MLKQCIGFNYLKLIIFIQLLFFQNSVNAGIGDKYNCEDYVNSVYMDGLKSNLPNYKFFLQWEEDKILKKYDNFQNIYTSEIVQQDSFSFVAWQYDKIGKSGITISTLDETNKDNILFIRAHVDSKRNATTSFFSKCKKIKY